MIKMLKKLGKKEWLLIIISIVFIVLQVWLDLKLPDYMSKITSLLTKEGTKVKEILNPGFYMLLCALGSLISAVVVGYIGADVAATFSIKLRLDVFKRVESFGMEQVKKFSTSSLITRTTNDITQVQMLISMGLQMIIKAPIMAVWAISKISSKSWQWSAVTAGSIVLLLIMISILIVFAIPKFKIIQDLTDNLNKVTRENLTGIRVIRAFNAEKFHESRFENANDKFTNTHLFTQRLMSIMSPGMSFIMSFLTLSIYFIGAFLIDAADITEKFNLFSNMVVFSSYAMQVIMSFMLLAFLFILYPRSSVSAKRIIEVLDTKSNIEDGKIAKNNKSNLELLEFKNVSFKYPDAEEYLLKDIDFEALKGETIAFIGSTGSGKSTLINLIPRFYDVSEGEILIDGINIKDYKLETLYNKIGYVSQKAVIFNGTVNENISFGNAKRKVRKQDILNAVKIAQGKGFIEKMPEKYESHLAQGGTNISGGQKQRIAIARAIARNPEIFIFDDSFSALDYKTDYTLRKTLRKITKDAITLIVAQRIGTIKNADKIIVLDNGKIVGKGKHADLLKDCQVYQEIALSQLSKEELSNA